MSRNLCRTDCYFCHGRVRFVEAARPITKDEAFVYYDEYAGMLVANAECEDCEGKYLAWVDEAPRVSSLRWGKAYHRSPDEDQTHVDLSFRSTFNDEPGPEDMPKYQIRETTIRERIGPAPENYWETLTTATERRY